MIKLLRIIGALVVLAIVGAVILYIVGSRVGPIPAPTVDVATLDEAARADLISRGKAVAEAADCSACHADPSGASSLGGGLPMKTGMGTIRASNISPSTEHGIGKWSSDDLYIAMTRGITPDGGLLYPAMPYASFNAITRADSDALYAWLMAQPPVEKPNENHDLAFPFNLRFGVAFWNALYRPAAEPFDAAVVQSPNPRGDYLVNVLGHCGECHTPRNFAFAMKRDQALQGGVIEGAYAPDLTPAAMASRGWTEADLVQFLHSGLSPQGVMTLGMFPVLSHSTA